MRKAVCILVLGILALTPITLGAWGVEVHRRITRRALEGLPEPLKAMYDPFRDFVVEHAVDPDEWRVAGLRGDLGPEDPNHFFEIASMGEPPPFAGVPRDWDTLVSRVGAERADKIGRLPFRALEMYGRLVTHFKGISTHTAYAADNARYISAVLAHYVEDAHQPLHVAENYDGQLTDQRGLHSRFETQLPLQLWSTLKLTPVRITPIPDVKAYLFATIVASHADVQTVIDADKRASVGLAHDSNNRLVYADGFFTRFGRDVQPVIEERISAAASGVASLIVQAWTDAGRPELK